MSKNLSSAVLVSFIIETRIYYLIVFFKNLTCITSTEISHQCQKAIPQVVWETINKILADTQQQQRELISDVNSRKIGIYLKIVLIRNKNFLF